MLLTFVLLGGSRSFVGPVLGGMVFTALPEVLRTSEHQRFTSLPNSCDGRLIILGAVM